ncbi:MAG: iron dicitrate transport regulator FecR [Phormidesmis priestleyi]|uniref:Iron dicitrate transport regulator FecR n=1 Tax=Phormidesmis priestleyi TaxID=268141 RepID=A0A2W4YMT5_9CYAN|nr:MAG: iron dicitrate transport regulator FecR [Phormidesmis priestleyi]
MRTFDWFIASKGAFHWPLLLFHPAFFSFLGSILHLNLLLSKRKQWPYWLVALLTAVLLICFSAAMVLAQPISLTGDRWLAITSVTGDVDITPYQGRRRQARLGDRLEQVGDSIATGANASARLDVDQAAGEISMAENSQLQVQALSITRSGGRITRLRVNRGQVRTRVRPFTNPDSELEIYTPAGVSGVRGTDFGVSVQPSGAMAVATQSGNVATSAQSQTVSVTAGLQSTVFPGEPPTAPEPLRNDPTLFVESISLSSDNQFVRLIGRTDAVNLLEIAGEAIALTRTGSFDTLVPIAAMWDDRQVSATVLTPLGMKQAYEVVVP